MSLTALKDTKLEKRVERTMRDGVSCAEAGIAGEQGLEKGGPQAIQAAQQIHMSSGQIQLRSVASAGRSPAQARQLRDLQRRLSQMLSD